MRNSSEERTVEILGEHSLNLLHNNGLLVISEDEWNELQTVKRESELEIKRLKKELFHAAKKLATWRSFGKSCS
ncbi:hypothetical protein QUF79_20905 [Fictibacillus enclensis]|uniref:hypothetical protein n=1 Tax=Fictibacillus enclensis TaxID=1017270 RepID=UPI0025A2F079|nr:hypothetical protein [Fictibacillus enclensis]MDM5200481.1 hypothetical protein [Fictibacillus enclensis]